ncbi:MAG: U32 family peptidase [Clostridia bacterium]|nr:U32 family peptidase [Clostridia bacterium]
MNKIELLAPAGDSEKLDSALYFGADAVYFAGKNYGLRAFAGNFSDDELIKAVEKVHSLNKKAYITLNVFARNKDFNGLADYLKVLEKAKIDACIVSDLGLFMFIRANSPNLTLHVSTQANTTNKYSAKSWADLGAKRIILARELSLEEIKEIRAFLPQEVELEAFVHGAMCISYSGRCLLSNYLTGRDSNHGECVQACRWHYRLVEDERPNEPLELEEDERGAYILNSKDLCLIDYLKDLKDAGICSFKIEGRMKSPYYVATVVNAYRRAIDRLEKGEEKDNEAFYSMLHDELKKASHRDYTTGFMIDSGKIRQNYASSSQIQESVFM